MMLIMAETPFNGNSSVATFNPYISTKIGPKTTIIVFYVAPISTILIRYHILLHTNAAKILEERSATRKAIIVINGPFLSARIPHGTLQIAELRIMSIKPILNK